VKRPNRTKGQSAKKAPVSHQEIGKPEISLAKNNHNGWYRQWLDSHQMTSGLLTFEKWTASRRTLERLQARR